MTASSTATIPGQIDGWAASSWRFASRDCACTCACLAAATSILDGIPAPSSLSSRSSALTLCITIVAHSYSTRYGTPRRENRESKGERSNAFTVPLRPIRTVVTRLKPLARQADEGRSRRRTGPGRRHHPGDHRAVFCGAALCRRPEARQPKSAPARRGTRRGGRLRRKVPFAAMFRKGLIRTDTIVNYLNWGT